jgi:uncharacterized protein YgiM (DUF1202 family)
MRLILYLVIAAVLFAGYIASRPQNHETTSTEQASSGSEAHGARDAAAPAGSLAGISANGSVAQLTTGPDATVAEVGWRVEAKRTVTAAQMANVRALPSMSGAVLRVLQKGTSVQVLESENVWLHVGERDDAAIGWVHGSLLK